MHPSTFEYLTPDDAQIETMARVREAARVFCYQQLSQRKSLRIIDRLHKHLNQIKRPDLA